MYMADCMSCTAKAEAQQHQQKECKNSRLSAVHEVERNSRAVYFSLSFLNPTQQIKLNIEILCNKRKQFQPNLYNRLISYQLQTSQMDQERNFDKEKERDRYRERDQRDRDENRQHKKKKKHKQDRRSRSNDSKKQKKHKRKHSRSPSESQKKHKKHHKDQRDSRDRRDRSRSKQREKRQRSKSQHREKKSRRRSQQKDSKERLSKKQSKRDQRRQQRREQERDEKRDDKRDQRRQQKKDQRRDQKIEQKREQRREERRQDPNADFKRREPKQLDEKDPYFEQRKEIQRIRRIEPEKAEKMQEDLQKQIIFDAKQREYELMKEKFRQAQKQLQEAKREDHTILVYCLPLKAREKDIWNFFSKAECGKIRDIRIIRDQRSGKSKGVAYVEFYTSESVEKALTMKQRPIEVKGRQFTGLKIQHSQAQKNRAAAAAKQMKVTKQVDPYQQQRQALKRQTKLQIRGLVGDLQNVDQNFLRQLFDPFGPIQFIDINRDPETGKCKGFAFIQYENIKDAKQAVREMDGIEVKKGHKIFVSTVSYIQKGDVSTGDDYLRSQGSKMALMNTLSRGSNTYSNLQRPPISTVPYPYIIMTNMFKMEGTSPEFFEKMKKDVQQTCVQFGIVEKIFIEKNNQGNVWIKFSDTVSSTKAQQKLNSQFFDGRKVFCYFVTEETWNKRVSV